MKKYILAMLVAAFVLGFSSCKKEESFNSNDLIGSWSQTEVYSIYKIDGKVDEDGRDNDENSKFTNITVH